MIIAEEGSIADLEPLELAGEWLVLGVPPVDGVDLPLVDVVQLEVAMVGPGNRRVAVTAASSTLVGDRDSPVVSVLPRATLAGRLEWR